MAIQTQSCLLLIGLFVATVVAQSGVLTESPFAGQRFSLSFLSTTAPDNAVFDEDMAEILAYYSPLQRLYVANALSESVDVIDINDPYNPKRLPSIYPNGTVASIYILNDVLGIAMVEDDLLVLADLNDNSILGSYPSGVQPDCVSGSNNKQMFGLACEGEPDDKYESDPEGSVWFYTLENSIGVRVEFTASNLKNTDNTGSLINTVTPHNLTFTKFNDVAITDPYIRIFGPGATVSQDLEPEYIVFSPDDSYAWVSLQENNAVAQVNLATMEIEPLHGLPFIDHSLPGNQLDATRDGQIKFGNWPLFGMPQPDGIFSFEQDGCHYLATANEGDDRDYDGFSEITSVKKVDLDPTIFPNAAELQSTAAIGDMRISLVNATNAAGNVTTLYSFGTRSYSIYNITDGAFDLVYTSGALLEEITALFAPQYFNSNDDSNDSMDSRSARKGPEPPTVHHYIFNDTPLLFVGLERISGVCMFDVTDLRNPKFLQYVTNRNFEATFDADASTDGFLNVGDLHTEHVITVPKELSPITDIPLMVSANPTSATVTIWALVDNSISARFDPSSASTLGTSFWMVFSLLSLWLCW